jgi:hypothetical protein
MQVGYPPRGKFPPFQTRGASSDGFLVSNPRNPELSRAPAD